MARHVPRISRDDLDPQKRAMLEASDADVEEVRAAGDDLDSFEAELTEALREAEDTTDRGRAADSLFVDGEGNIRSRRALLRPVRED